MCKRQRTWLLLLALVEALLVLTAVYFEPTHRVRGHLWGEAFFEGRPTSYWRALIEMELAEDIDLHDEFWGNSKPSFWESLGDRVGIRARRQRSHLLIMHSGGDAVLAELKADRSPRIRSFAERVIDYNTNELPRLANMKPPFGLEIVVIMPWKLALDKARELPESK